MLQKKKVRDNLQEIKKTIPSQLPGNVMQSLWRGKIINENLLLNLLPVGYLFILVLTCSLLQPFGD